jgi:catalase
MIKQFEERLQPTSNRVPHLSKGLMVGRGMPCQVRKIPGQGRETFQWKNPQE